MGASCVEGSLSLIIFRVDINSRVGQEDRNEELKGMLTGMMKSRGATIRMVPVGIKGKIL